jgi:hypothetical protein
VKLVGVVSPGYIGETFVLWTIEYLSGKTHLVDPLTSTIHDVSDNPLTDRNCHNHHKIRLRSKEEIVQGINYFRKNSIGPSIFHAGCNTVEDSELLHNQKVSIVSLDFSDCDLIYDNVVNRSGLLPNSTTPGTELEAILKKYYFGNTIFDNLSNGEVREQLALYMDVGTTYRLGINNSIPHYTLTTDDLWNDFDIISLDMMRWLDITVVDERYEKWQSVYKTWRTFHWPHKKFSRDLSRIVNAIVRREYMDLTVYKLDLIKEAVILHQLMQRHSKSIKLIDRFPSNTQDFFTVLEDFV